VNLNHFHRRVFEMAAPWSKPQFVCNILTHILYKHGCEWVGTPTFCKYVGVRKIATYI
jgi:hypothetical protein